MNTCSGGHISFSHSRTDIGIIAEQCRMMFSQPYGTQAIAIALYERYRQYKPCMHAIVRDRYKD
jgi:hypothetical protein